MGKENLIEKIEAEAIEDCLNMETVLNPSKIEFTNPISSEFDHITDVVVISIKLSLLAV